MTHDRTARLFFEIFNSELPRHSPGDEASTLQALSLIPKLGSASRVLDLGCGTGPHTVVLAHHTDARIVAIDSHEPFLTALAQRAWRLGVGGRIEARIGDMRQLDYAPGSFDVIWCEGAIYNIGFELGLRQWRHLLTPSGYVAVSEVCWTRPNAPPECEAFWRREYPVIRDVDALLAAIDDCGYETAGHFTLPDSSWWDEFYQPLQRNVREFRDRHKGESDADALADQIQSEIDVRRAYSDFYGYEFFVIHVR